MPTISVDKAELFKELGRSYTTEEFDELCFDYGLELDEDTTDTQRPIVDGVEEPPQLKIEVPANRYDMLCFEGIASNLKVFLGQKEFPKYRLRKMDERKLQIMNVDPETARIRPYVSCSILRNIAFNKERYNSFIALQDKLHQNLARQRTLVAIGTHDMSKIEGPFSYEALPPEKISFAPLNQKKEMNAKQLMEFYEKDKHLSRYLPIIRDSPVYPVIYDKHRTVLSLPPVINGDHTKISVDTKDVFMEMTATDPTKLEIVNCIMVAMFSEYCDEQFVIEPVQINSPHNKQTRITPNLDPIDMQAEVSYINSCCGLSLPAPDICKHLQKMGYTATPNKKEDVINIKIPPTRADVLHQADIMEDVAVAYGFNKLPRTFPSKALTISAAHPVGQLSDILRLEAAAAGWTEVLPLILCSHEENFEWLHRKDDGKTAVRLQNPKTAEYQIVRTSLVPGLLKSIAENRHQKVPLKIFETSDVAFKAPDLERKARNERHFAAAWYGKNSGFEIVHGLLDRMMETLAGVLWLGESWAEMDEKTKTAMRKAGFRYWLEQTKEDTFLGAYQAGVHFQFNDKEGQPVGKPQRIGELGVLHPSVLDKFDLSLPVTTLEINIEFFK